MHVIISDEGKKKSGWLSKGNTIKKPISKLNFGFLSNHFFFQRARRQETQETLHICLVISVKSQKWSIMHLVSLHMYCESEYFYQFVMTFWDHGTSRDPYGYIKTKKISESITFIVKGGFLYILRNPGPQCGLHLSSKKGRRRQMAPKYG